MATRTFGSPPNKNKYKKWASGSSATSGTGQTTINTLTFAPKKVILSMQGIFRGVSGFMYSCAVMVISDTNDLRARTEGTLEKMAVGVRKDGVSEESLKAGSFGIDVYNYVTANGFVFRDEAADGGTSNKTVNWIAYG